MVKSSESFSLTLGRGRKRRKILSFGIFVVTSSDRTDKQAKFQINFEL